MKRVESFQPSYDYQRRNPAIHWATQRLSDIVTHVNLRGVEHLEEANRLRLAGYSIAITPNHVSLGDPHVLYKGMREAGRSDMVDNTVVMVGKVGDYPVIGKFTNSIHKFRVWPISVAAETQEKQIERDKINDEAYEIAKKALRQKKALLIFLEGTRSRNNQLVKGPTDGVRYLLGKDTRILPVSIIGMHVVMPPMEVVQPGLFGIKIPIRRSLVIINFGEVYSLREEIKEVRQEIKVVGGTHDEQQDAFRSAIRDRAMMHIARGLPLEMRGPYRDMLTHDFYTSDEPFYEAVN